MPVEAYPLTVFSRFTWRRLARERPKISVIALVTAAAISRLIGGLTD